MLLGSAFPLSKPLAPGRPELVLSVPPLQPSFPTHDRSLQTLYKPLQERERRGVQRLPASLPSNPHAEMSPPKGPPHSHPPVCGFPGGGELAATSVSPYPPRKGCPPFPRKLGRLDSDPAPAPWQECGVPTAGTQAGSRTGRRGGVVSAPEGQWAGGSATPPPPHRHRENQRERASLFETKPDTPPSLSRKEMA